LPPKNLKPLSPCSRQSMRRFEHGEDICAVNSPLILPHPLHDVLNSKKSGRWPSVLKFTLENFGATKIQYFLYKLHYFNKTA
jgi:hypothetical protein